MAAIAKSAELRPTIGKYTPFATGVTVMASGTATVELGSKFSEVYGAVGSIADAVTGVGQTVTFSFSGTTMTIETISEAGALTGTSLVSWIAFGKPRA
jgi:hypothetical protein